MLCGLETGAHKLEDPVHGADVLVVAERRPGETPVALSCRRRCQHGHQSGLQHQSLLGQTLYRSVKHGRRPNVPGHGAILRSEGHGTFFQARANLQRQAQVAQTSLRALDMPLAHGTVAFSWWASSAITRRQVIALYMSTSLINLDGVVMTQSYDASLQERSQMSAHSAIAQLSFQASYFAQLAADMEAGRTPRGLLLLT